VTFTARVTPTAATGNTQFLDGMNAIGTAALSGGSATLAVSNLAVGSHSLTAWYGGAAGYAASTSAAVAVIVVAALPPSGLTAKAVSSSQINLDWKASGTSGLTYNVYASDRFGLHAVRGEPHRVQLDRDRILAHGPASLVHALLSGHGTECKRRIGALQPGKHHHEAGISCRVTYTVTTQWNAGFGTAIAIKNTGSTPINSWRLTWTWPGNQQITQAWNSNYSNRSECRIDERELEFEDRCGSNSKRDRLQRKL
jgi:Cellulose binding domain/Bacterial Ig-like domain (group 3)